MGYINGQKIATSTTVLDGNGYYNKEQTDAKLAEKADVTYVDENDANLQSQINSLITTNYATLNSTYISNGRVYYHKIGELCIVNFVAVTFTEQAKTDMAANNTSIIVSGLPTPKPLASQPSIIVNLLGSGGKTVRVGKGYGDGNISSWWYGPSVDVEYSGVLIYRCN